MAKTTKKRPVGKQPARRTRTVVVPVGINTELIEQRRKEMKVTYAEMAALAGLDPTRLSKILRYDQAQLENMKAGTLLTLSAAIGVSVDLMIKTGTREIEIGPPPDIPKKNAT